MFKKKNILYTKLYDFFSYNNTMIFTPKFLFRLNFYLHYCFLLARLSSKIIDQCSIKLVS